MGEWAQDYQLGSGYSKNGSFPGIGNQKMLAACGEASFCYQGRREKRKTPSISDDSGTCFQESLDSPEPFLLTFTFSFFMVLFAFLVHG